MKESIRPGAAIKPWIPGALRKVLRRWLSRVVTLESHLTHVDISEQEWSIIGASAPISMTSYERLVGLIRAVDYLHDNKISGDIVECGVFKGASMLAAATRLAQLGEVSRTLWLYDTFEGMPAPDERDVDYGGKPATDIMARHVIDENSSTLTNAPLDEVKANIAKARYAGPVRYVVGKVEDTLPAQRPEKIALLRLDTDWYASTKHELEHLYSQLVPGGVLIIDDYGHFQGARQAVDEFIAELPYPLHLTRMDYSGRLAIKPWGA